MKKSSSAPRTPNVEELAKRIAADIPIAVAAGASGDPVAYQNVVLLSAPVAGNFARIALGRPPSFGVSDQVPTLQLEMRRLSASVAEIRTLVQGLQK